LGLLFQTLRKVIFTTELGNEETMRRREFLTGVAGTAAYGLSARLIARQRPLRVGVVGNGIVGASIAFHLAEAGAQVTTFEKAQPANGATKNSFAWLNAFVSDPHYRDLRLSSLQAYHDLDRRLRLGITWAGYIDWVSATEQVAALRAAGAQLNGTPYAVRSISAAELIGIVPSLVTGPVAAAFFSRVDGHLDPVQVTQRFLTHARRHGATTLYSCEVQDLDLRGDALAGAITARGHVPLDHLVVAAGVDTPYLLAKAGYHLKLRHAPGILAHSKPIAAVTPVVFDAPGGVSFKQMSDGSVVGTDSPEPPDIPVHHEIRERAIDFPNEALRMLHGNRILTKIAAFLPAARGVELDRLTLGFRPMPIDELPVVGAVPGIPNLYVVVTHSGVTLAPILGRYVTQEILHDSPAEFLTPYRPERFLASLAGAAAGP
jgi:glycine/D-amino acid oxidase-like deaminating enzyme